MNKALSSGVSGAAPIWQRIFIEAFKLGYNDGIMPKPEKVVAQEIDALFGGSPREGVPTRSEYFLSSNVPKEQSLYYQKLKISRSDNRLANATEIANSDYDEKEYYVITEQDPLSTDDHNRWQEAINSWANEQSDDKYKPPKETSTKDFESITLQINEPKNNSRLDNNSVRIYAKAVSNVNLKSFEVRVNNEVKIQTSEPVIDQNIHLENGVYQISFIAKNEKDKESGQTITVGVNEDPQPTASPEPTVAPTTAPNPTGEPTATITDTP